MKSPAHPNSRGSGGLRLVAPQCCAAREDRGARTASKSQDDSNPAIFISPQEIGSMDGMSVAKAERRSSILALQKSCREDRSPRSSASLAASSTTDKAVQFNARKQSSPRAFFCWPIESTLTFHKITPGEGAEARFEQSDSR